jgi:microcystin-dependent protein
MSAAIPPGTILQYAGGTVPTGFLLCNGATNLNTTTYADLFAAIGYTYGGSGGTFSIPDGRGVFIRGAGSQTIGSVTYSGTLAAKQNDAYPSHNHGGGNHNHGIKFYNGGPAGNNDGVIGSGNYQIVNNNTAVASGTIIASNGSGTETQPANLCVNYIIKY